MHVTHINQMQDKGEISSFIQRFSFGTIVTSTDEKPIATYLLFAPFEKEDKCFLSYHFNKAHPQRKHNKNNTTLVIFTESHAYISPTNYGKHPSVPTWNYVSVHAYGKRKEINDKKEVQDSIIKLIKMYEESYLDDWYGFPDLYRDKMLQGIVAFEIEVSEIVTSNKLSQNKTPDEQRNIITSLSGSHSLNDKLIAEYMLNNLKP